MKHFDFKSLILTGMVLALASCSEDTFPGGDQPDIPGGRPSNEICFIVEQPSSPSRSGSPCESRRAGGAYLYADGSDSLYMALSVSEIDDNILQSRALYIDAEDINTLMMTCRSRSNDGAKYYFSNTRFSKSGDVWVSDPPYWWQNDESMHYNFYGYAPAEITGAKYSEGTNFYPTLEYTVPPNAVNQTDIVYNALTQEYISSENTTVPLKMEHALACISFVCGKGMAPGTINSVTLSDVKSHATLSLKDGTWSAIDTPADFTASTGTSSTDGADITSSAGKTLFMLIPQTGTFTVDINFTAADGTTRTYSGTIEADWQAGNQYRYAITIDPDLSIDIVPSTQDAHYVIAKTHVAAANLQPGQSWQMTVSANDGARVTLLADATLNEYQRNGYWIDEIVNVEGNSRTTTNARGDATLTGTGPTDISIFLPENVSDNNRTITLSLKIAGMEKTFDSKTFEQYHPAWTDGGFGWEQIQGDNAQFGFDWNYVVYYGYLYSAPLIFGNKTYENYCQSIIDNNNAGGYASVETYSYKWGQQRYCIKIDYSQLSSFKKYTNSRTDGLANTKDMNGIAGTAVTNAFEGVVANIKKTESGKETENAFRIGNGDKNEAPAPTGNPITSSPAIGNVLKKNRYYILRTTTYIDGEPNVSEVPKIDEKDIVWYMPAVDQFSTIPTGMANPIVAGNCWSSNAETSSNANAYLGNNTLAGRSTLHEIRACRNRP